MVMLTPVAKTNLGLSHQKIAKIGGDGVDVAIGRLAWPKGGSQFGREAADLDQQKDGIDQDHDCTTQQGEQSAKYIGDDV